MKIVLMPMTESFLTFFICYSSAHLTNQKPANPAAQPMRALPAPPLRRNSCGHLAPVSRRPAPVVLTTVGACHLGKQLGNIQAHMVDFAKWCVPRSVYISRFLAVKGQRLSQCRF